MERFRMQGFSCALEKGKTWFLNIPKETGARWSWSVLYWAFLLSLLTLPLGQAFREAGPIVGLIALAGYHYWAKGDTNFSKLPVRWLFWPFYILLLVNVPLSIAPLESWKVLSPNIWKGLALPFIGMEAVRNLRDLKRMFWICVIVCFYEGADGIYQYFTGYDFIHGDPWKYGRLTGSMTTFRVGNMLAMYIMPAGMLWFVLDGIRNRYARLAACTVLLFPAVFLLIGAQTRSAYLGILVASMALYCRIIGYPKIRYVLSVAGCIVLVLFFGPYRFSWERIVKDGRWELWDLGFNVFKEHPWFGAGIGAFNPAFNALGLVPVQNSTSIPHPHSIYVQMLCETGLVGTAVALLFFVGMTLWSGRIIGRALRSTTTFSSSTAPHRLYWLLTAGFWAGFVAFLGSGISAHSLFRTWWLALAMSLLGIVLGACVSGNQRAVSRPDDSAYNTDAQSATL